MTRHQLRFELGISIEMLLGEFECPSYQCRSVPTLTEARLSGDLIAARCIYILMKLVASIVKS